MMRGPSAGGEEAHDALSMLRRESADVAPHEPTLANTLRGLAEAQLPSRFYLVLQLAAPTGFELWSLGWHRSAMVMLAVSAFGVWALCEQQRSALVPSAWIGVVRKSAGTLAALTAAGVALEAFLRLMSVVFRCPGCAG